MGSIRMTSRALKVGGQQLPRIQIGPHRGGNVMSVCVTFVGGLSHVSIVADFHWSDASVCSSEKDNAALLTE